MHMIYGYVHTCIDCTEELNIREITMSYGHSRSCVHLIFYLCEMFKDALWRVHKCAANISVIPIVNSQNVDIRVCDE